MGSGGAHRMDAGREPLDQAEDTELTRIRADILQSPDLPAMPLAYARLLSVVADESSTPQELVEVLELDPSLAGRILRLANSAFLGVPGKVSSLSRAVLLLGWKWVSSLALGVTVWSSFATRGGAPAVQLWGHAARVALASRLLGQHLGLKDAEAAFSAGLLHDIGRAVLAVRHREHGDWIADPTTDVDLEGERALFGVDHATVGLWVATSWGLPAPLIDAMALHHDDIVPEDQLDALAVVRLADRLIHDAERESEDEAELEAQFAATIEAMAPGRGVVEAWPGIVETVREEGRDLESIFTGAE